jgi:hypothetical protein
MNISISYREKTVARKLASLLKAATSDRRLLRERH